MRRTFVELALSQGLGAPPGILCLHIQFLDLLMTGRAHDHHPDVAHLGLARRLLRVDQKTMSWP
jgi:hypothetical protein